MAVVLVLLPISARRVPHGGLVEFNPRHKGHVPQLLKGILMMNTTNADHGATMTHNQLRGEAPAYMHIRKTRHRTALRARHWKAHGGHQYERETT